MMKTLKDWYIGFCAEEYYADEDESEQAFNHAAAWTHQELDVLYSRFDDENAEEHDVQVSLKLIPAAEIVYVDGEQIYYRQFESVDALCQSYDGATWDDIYNWAIDKYGKVSVA